MIFLFLLVEELDIEEIFEPFEGDFSNWIFNKWLASTPFFLELLNKFIRNVYKNYQISWDILKNVSL